MSELRTIAIRCESAAFSALIGSVLSDQPGLRVRIFDSAAELAAYMRIVPVHLVVCDDRIEGDSIVPELMSLRRDTHAANAGFGVLALTRKGDALLRADVAYAGISEVMGKPMSPLYLAERVLALAALPRPLRRPPEDRIDITELPPMRRDNVVPLFPQRGPAARPH